MRDEARQSGQDFTPPSGKISCILMSQIAASCWRRIRNDGKTGAFGIASEASKTVIARRRNDDAAIRLRFYAFILKISDVYPYQVFCAAPVKNKATHAYFQHVAFTCYEVRLSAVHLCSGACKQFGPIRDKRSKKTPSSVLSGAGNPYGLTLRL
jgi:hypothetical protein